MNTIARIAGFLVLGIISISPAHGAKRHVQVIQDCDTQVLSKTERNLKSLKAKDIERLFLTFDDDCTHYDDFHKWGNELLFRTLQHKPKLFIKELDIIPNGKRRAILIELESPLHNGFDLPTIIRKVSKIKGHDRTRDDVLRALRDAKVRI